MNDAEVIKRYLAEEMVEEYMEGRMSRRSMVRVIGQILGVATVGPALLTSLGCATPTGTDSRSGAAQPAQAPAPSAPAQQPAPAPAQSGASVVEEMAEYQGAGGAIKAYLARPGGPGPFPAVLLIHENRGLTEHNRDVARRFARAGYVGLAVDLLSRVGGTAQFQDAAQATAAISRLMPNDVVEDLRTSVSWLESREYVREGKMAAIGWCWGGGMAWRFATAEPKLGAVAAYYGPNPPLEAVPQIQGAVLGIYGSNDRRITDGMPTLDEALKKAGKTYEMKVFEGADHAFFNDTGARYNAAAATEAWEMTLAFFEKHLKA